MYMICQPLQAEQAVQAQQRRRDRRAERHRDRQADQEARNDARMVVGREPVGEVEHDAGKKPASATPSRKRTTAKLVVP